MILVGAEGSDGLNTGGTGTGGGSGMEAMGLAERRTLLSTMCGVISVILSIRTDLFDIVWRILR